MRRWRVVVADDHPKARAGIRAILAGSDRFEIVAEAESAAAALAAVRAKRPDLVLMDIRMPGGGLSATTAIRREFPRIAVVVVTVSDDVQDLFEAVKCGAQGYLLKSLEAQDWLAYLDQVMRGEAHISREIASKMLREFAERERAAGARERVARRTGPEEAGNPDDGLGLLSKREIEVLQRVAQGETNRQIADALFIAENTVKNHLKNILAKLHLTNRVQLAAFAARQGLDPGE